MSIAVDCPSCAIGNHDRHDRAHGLRPGLIGGTYCGCTGDCAERSAALAAEFRAKWAALDPDPETAAPAEQGATE